MAILAAEDRIVSALRTSKLLNEWFVRPRGLRDCSPSMGSRGFSRSIRFSKFLLCAGRRGLVTAFSVGRIISDLELKTSAKDVPYLRLTLAERLGNGENARTQFIQVWAWSALANQLQALGVGKGSRIWVFGSLELTSFMKADGVTRDKVLKLKLMQWGYAGSENIAEKTFFLPEDFGNTEVVDGDRESLPA